MISIGVKNLRRLTDIDPVQLRPITILVGKNSSGKSSFLRILPLIRQSLFTRTSAPLLWYGDLVDFGSYKSVVSGGDITKEIVFSFVIKDLTLSTRYEYVTDLTWVSGGPGPSIGEVRVNLTLKHHMERTVLSRIQYDAPAYGLKVSMSIDESKFIATDFTINDVEVSKYLEDIAVFVQRGQLFPALNLVSRDVPAHRPMGYRLLEERLAGEICKELKPRLHGRTSNERALEVSKAIMKLDKFSSNELTRLDKQKKYPSLQKYISGVKTSIELRRQASSIFHLNKFFSVHHAAAEWLRDFFSQVLYVGPMRARSERYYRLQELAVSEIEPDGRNFPMFLYSLAKSDIDRFSSWVEKIYGFRVNVSSQEGHISINLEKNRQRVNIVDTGYGVSQVLPVLGQIWWATNGLNPSRRNKMGASGRVIAIEQPELHLHPAHQALLADALVDSVNRRSEQRRAINVLIETHSESLINRLGQLIEKGTLKSDDIQIIVFDQDSELDEATVTLSHFSDEGFLVNWPFGFFEAV